MSQSSGLWRQEPSIPAHNISHQHIIFLATAQRDISPGPGLVWLEHHTSNSLPKMQLWALGILLDTPAGGNPLLRTSQKQTSLCCSPYFSLCSCLLEGLSYHGIEPTAPSQLWPHSNSGSGGAFSSLPVSWVWVQGLFRYALCYVGGDLIGLAPGM
jgi:hypothetical protein